VLVPGQRALADCGAACPGSAWPLPNRLARAAHATEPAEGTRKVLHSENSLAASTAATQAEGTSGGMPTSMLAQWPVRKAGIPDRRSGFANWYR